MHHEQPPSRFAEHYHPKGVGNLETAPTLTAGQRDVVLLFLRRYVTWCVRAGRIPAAEGARVLAKRVGRARVTLDEQPGAGPERPRYRLPARPADAAPRPPKTGFPMRIEVQLAIARWGASAALLLACFGAHAGPWRYAGPANAGFAVFTHPAQGGQAIVYNSPYLFVGRSFATQDGGAHWFVSPTIVGDVQLSGTPTVAYSVSDSVVNRSLDFGRSWGAFAKPPNGVGYFDLVRIHPSNPAEWIAMVGGGIWHTSDSGTSWAVFDHPNFAPPRQLRDLAVDWDARTVFASFGPDRRGASRGIDGNGVWTLGGTSATLLAAGHGIAMYLDGAKALFRSSDGGATYQQVAQALGALDLCDLRFSTAPAQMVYALECTTGRTFRSADDGATWTPGATLAGTDWYSRVAVDAANASRLYVATSFSIMQSDDGATSFHALDRSTGAPGSRSVLHFDASDPSLQWLAVAELAFLSKPPTGFVRTKDGGATWTHRGGAARFLGASRYRTNTVFGARSPGVDGDKDFSVSRNGGETWSAKLSAPERYWKYDFLAYGAAPNELFLYGRVDQPTCCYVPKVYYSTTDGDSFVERTAPPIVPAFLVAAQSGPGALYAGGGGRADVHLYRSKDAAMTWEPVAFFPSSFGAYEGFLGNTITAFAIDPVDPKRLYAGFYYPDYVLRSDDEGATWTPITRGLGAGWITSLVVDPANPATVYATQFGGGVFRSTDRGQTWAALDEGMHEDTPLRVHVDPFVAGRLHASTMSGLFSVDLTTGVPAGDRRAVEYYHQEFDHYFVTVDAHEIAGLDAGTFQGWRRTLEGFRVAATTSPSSLPVCRFFGVGFAPLSSHFYTPYPTECEFVKADPKWLYETIAFGLALPNTNTLGCQVNSRPLYRLWNAGLSGAPNHRYTTSTSTFGDMINQGWVFEGVGSTQLFACVPY